jgi:hypothetical protein
MTTILSFLTILAWVFGPVALLRLILLLFVAPSDIERDMMHLAELTGSDPLGEAVGRALVLLAVCIIWIVARWNT